MGVHGLTDLFALAFDSSNKTMYAAQFLNSTPLEIMNLTTGAATPVGASIANARFGAMAFDSLTKQLIGLEACVSSCARLFVIDPITGVGTLLKSGLATNLSGMTYDPVLNRLWNIDNDGRLGFFDPANGFAQTQVTTYPLLEGCGGGDAHGCFDGLAFVGPPTLSPKLVFFNAFKEAATSYHPFPASTPATVDDLNSNIALTRLLIDLANAIPLTDPQIDTLTLISDRVAGIAGASAMAMVCLDSLGFDTAACGGFATVTVNLAICGDKPFCVVPALVQNFNVNPDFSQYRFELDLEFDPLTAGQLTPGLQAASNVPFFGNGPAYDLLTVEDVSGTRARFLVEGISEVNRVPTPASLALLILGIGTLSILRARYRV